MTSKLEDVARRSGVSPTTVSHVLNGKGRVSDPQYRVLVGPYRSVTSGWALARAENPVADVSAASHAGEVTRPLPRALTPFRTPAYRWLAVSLTASSFAAGVWIVALVWEVIRLGGGPGDLSFVTTASAIGVRVTSSQTVIDSWHAMKSAGTTG